MSNLKEVLKEYGADVDDIIADTLDDDAFVGLEDAIESKNIELAFRKTHSLKGIALNMGLTAFYNSVVNVVEDLREGGSEALPSLVEDMMKEKEKIQLIYETFRYMLD